MTVQQYDEIGEAYEGFKTLPLARYSEVPSFLGMLGPLAGRSVLDLACGTGFYSRSIKRLGAADVLGVDISGEMVAAARGIEERDPLGIRYEVLNAAQLPDPERKFDAATAVYLLNYADDEETLFRMCRGVHRSLADGGEFCVLTQNPSFRFDGPSTDPYGFRYERVGVTAMGPRVHITALLDPPISFDTNYPAQAVYEHALGRAGFRDVTWVPLEVPAASMAAFAPGFWDDYLANQPLTMLRCTA
ncbi:class I SAM-dependent methyltransferase [Streptomyces sp. NPDC021093]|uniref:class I SAM-dependent methyltransferase n=1 Tax=Streptomyces sp. NPDC021093 TaxID=3365112 RepID=UPI00378E7E8C